MTIKEFASVMDEEVTLHIMIGPQEVIPVGVKEDRTLLQVLGDVVIDRVCPHSPNNCTIYAKTIVVKEAI